MIRLIAAIDNKRGIARDGQIPWDLPMDKAYFQSQTLKFGGKVLMGINTFKQFDRPLKGRTNYVLSHALIRLPDGAILVNDLKSYLNDLSEDLWVIGGENVYSQTIALANELYLTTLEADFKCDQFFPSYEGFKLKFSDGPHSENNLKYYFKVFERIQAHS